MVLQSRSRFSTFQVKNMGVLDSWTTIFPLQTRRFSDSMMISIYSLLKQPAGFSFLQDHQLIAVYGTPGGFAEPSRSPTPRIAHTERLTCITGAGVWVRVQASYASPKLEGMMVNSSPISPSPSCKICYRVGPFCMFLDRLQKQHTDQTTRRPARWWRTR